MIAVFQKELRDCLRWSPLGMALGLVMLWMVLLGNNVDSATFMESSLASQLGLAASLIAIALGLLQSLPDARNDARGYLMHRPIKPNKIFWSKIAAGYVTYVITLAVPVIVAMIYLQAKGIERLPTNALQVIPFLLCSCVAFLFHPTVLWIVSRNARWVGTRLIPAIGAIAFAYYTSYYFQFDGLDYAIDSLPTIAILVVTCCVFTYVTFLSARHTFVHQSQLPDRSSSNWFSLPCMIGLVVSGVVLCGIVIAIVASSIPGSPKDSISYQLSLDDQGQWHQLATRRSKFNWDDVQLLTRNVDGKGKFKKVDKEWAPAQIASLIKLSSDSPYHFEQFRSLTIVESKMAASKEIVLVSHRNRLLLYDTSKELISIATPTGISNAWEDSKERFTGLKVHAWQKFNGSRHNFLGASNPLLVDDNGMYQLIADECRPKRLTSNGGADMVTLLLGEEDSPAAIWALAGDKLTQYEIELEPSAEGFVIDWNYVKTEERLFLPPIKKILDTQSWQIEPLSRNESLRIARTPDGQHAIIRNNKSTFVSDYAVLKDNGVINPIGTSQLPQVSSGFFVPTMAWAVPPALITAVLAIFSLFYSLPNIESAGMIFPILCHSIIAAAATWCLSGRYQLSKSGRTVWTITGLLLGFGTLVGMASIYRRHLKAECPRCSEDRRVDLESCEHCGKPWDPPEQEGIEIFEHDRSLSQLETPSLS